VLRLFGVGLLGGFAAGAAAGLGARLVMWTIAIQNHSHDGEITHANSQVGRFTAAGTVNLVVQGALIFGIPGAVVYLLVRSFLPRRALLRGLTFGTFLLLALFGSFLQDNAYEYGRYVSPAVAVSLFALLFPLFGVVLALVVDRGGRGDVFGNRVVLWGGRGVLTVFGVLGALGLVEELRNSFGLLGG
jgi:hypothetical protein